MERRKLLKGLGIAGLATVLPVKGSAAAFQGKVRQAELSRPAGASCWLTPETTEGPYYFDPGLLRSDIRLDTQNNVLHDGLPLDLTISVVNVSCQPVAGVLVDIWHANRGGLYSGYVQPQGNTTNQNFLRGTQVTDEQGNCRFETIYPGWYPGRTTHIHFKVRLSSMAYVTSQFAFEDAVNADVYDTALYADRGQNTTTNASDGVFRDATPEHLLAEVEPDPVSGGYRGTYTIGIDSPTDIDQDVRRPEECWLAPNYPNPFAERTAVTYNLNRPGHVEISVFDAAGKMRAKLVDEQRQAGQHVAPFDAGGLPSGYYFCRMRAGEYVAIREMLLIRR
ncbi:T9SS type A sorting domain-containing protein [bacterium]|nr:T9SS type A sorting domain-containing protein [bacterium]